jgi:hypothetical protein
MAMDHANEGRREDKVFLMHSVRQINIVARSDRVFDVKDMKHIRHDRSMSTGDCQVLAPFCSSTYRMNGMVRVQWYLLSRQKMLCLSLSDRIYLGGEAKVCLFWIKKLLWLIFRRTLNCFTKSFVPFRLWFGLIWNRQTNVDPYNRSS